MMNTPTFGRAHLVAAMDNGTSRVSAAALLIDPAGRHELLWHGEHRCAANASLPASGLLFESLMPVVRHARQNLGCTFDGIALTGRNIEATDPFMQTLRCNDIEVVAQIPQVIAASQAVLGPNDIETGVCLIHLGNARSSIAIYHDGSLRHQEEIPGGGADITLAIAAATGMPTRNAEEIKVAQGVALAPLLTAADAATAVSVPRASPAIKPITRACLANVIQMQLEQILLAAEEILRRTNWYDLMSNGILITGGSANLAGIKELGEEVFHTIVRVGRCRRDSPLSGFFADPRHAAVAGALLIAAVVSK